MEGTGSYGAGLARFLAAHGQRVLEVNRPDRAARRHGKNDPVDADAAARAVQAGEATGHPKAQDGPVEMVRALRVARQSAVKARTQAINALKGLLVTAPAELREQLEGLSTARLIRPPLPWMLDRWPPDRGGDACPFRPGPPLPAPGRRDQPAHRHPGPAHRHRRPRLRALLGVGPDSAATLLIAAGDNPGRLHSEAAFAALCGTSPVEASSGKTRRHRLNRAGTAKPTPPCTGS